MLNHLVEFPSPKGAEHSSMLVLHQLANRLNQVWTVQIILVVRTACLQDASPVGKQVSYDAAILDARVFGLNMEHPPIVLDVIIKTQ